MNKWGWHYEADTFQYVFYGLKDGEAKMRVAAEVAETAPPCAFDPYLHRLIERVLASR